MRARVRSGMCQWRCRFRIQEARSGPYTTVKGKVNMRTLKTVASVEHIILNGAGLASVVLAMDHFKEEYKVGVGLRIQSM